MTIRSNRMSALLILLGVVAALGESVPAHAKDPVGAPVPIKDADQMITLNPKTLKFTPIPDMPACASAAILRGNPRFEPAWVLLKLASGCRVPWHWHTANETLLVISGRGIVEMKDGLPLKFVPGAFSSLPSHHMHQATCFSACLLFNTADAAFDVHYVDAKGEEISPDEALKPLAKAKAKKK
jgi:quercetin dioxygenase-like cupin family protein